MKEALRHSRLWSLFHLWYEKSFKVSTNGLRTGIIAVWVHFQVKNLRSSHTTIIELMEKGEGFSGKRPFGNSGWEYELYEPLIKGGALEGKFDSDGCVEEAEDQEAYALIYKAIDAL